MNLGFYIAILKPKFVDYQITNKNIVMKTILKLTLIFLLSATLGQAQDDLMGMLDADDSKKINVTSATFKGTRLINGHSIETVKKKHLDFMINHRFGRLNDGLYNLFGLDYASARFSFEYGLTNDLTVGLGRSSIRKTYDLYAKYRLLKQSTGARKMPFSVTLFGSTIAETLDREQTFQNQLSYTGQLLIARKFSEKLSLQLMPTFMYRNVVPTKDHSRALVALGVGGRYKLNKRLSINAEYYMAYRKDGLQNQFGEDLGNSLAIGFDIETGGHVFQLHFTNSAGMTEKQFIGDTVGSWLKGDIRYGFNLSRTFSFE
jgi:hypothetical protein